MTGLAAARRIALALPETTEEPHHEKTSFRVRGKIFATAPPGGEFLHALLEEPAVEAWTAEDPAAFAPLRWGQRIRGVRVTLAVVPGDRLAELLEEAWRRRAPRRLAAELDAARGARQPGPVSNGGDERGSRTRPGPADAVHPASRPGP